MTDGQRRVVVLGVGNPLYGDDGFGIRAVAAFEHCYRTGPEVECVDGGTDGMGLLGVIEEATDLVLLDAVVGHGAPGTLVEIDGRDLAGGTKLKLSEHQLGIQEVLGLASWRERLPERMMLVGVEAASLDFGLELTPQVAAALPAVLARAADHLRNWGIQVEALASDAPREA